MQRAIELVDAALASGLGSAAALSVGDGGVEVARYAAGHAWRIGPPDPPAIDEHWRFDVASLTKPMVTAACAMALVGDGRLALDAPIRRWLPDAASTGTVAQLLGHAAGCAAHVEFFRELRLGVPDPRAALVALAARTPADAPGVRAVYSDLGYVQLGAIVARAADAPLEAAYASLVADRLGLGACYGPVARAVATEVDERGLVCGRVHDENAYYGGEVCGHAGLFATIGDVAAFAAWMVSARDPVVERFVTTSAAPGASWRLGWDTPSAVPRVSHAGDRWPRVHAIGHLGFTGTSLWLDLARRRWVALLTNRVHPSRHGSADAIKALRRAVNDAALAALDGEDDERVRG